MRKNIYICIISLPFLFLSNLYAGPEKYDHLEAYKRAVVNAQGPAEELVQDAKGKPLAKAVYSYNEKKQIAEIKFYVNSSFDGKNIYIYDESGLKKEELYDRNNKLVEKVVYSKNHLNQVTEFEVFDANNASLLKWKFQYDDKRVASGSRYINNEMTEKFVNEYSSNGLVQHIFVDTKESTGNITVSLSNSLVTKRIKKEPAGVHSIDYFYDKEGRIEKMIFSKLGETEVKVEKTHLFHYTVPYVVQPVKVTEH